MIAGLFWMVAANGAALLGAHAGWRRIRTGDPAVDLVLFLVLHLLGISAAVVIAGVAGFLTPIGLGLPGAAILALLILLGEGRHLHRPSKPDIGRATVVLAALIGLRMLLQVWFFAPASGDALAYHLPKIGEWIRAGAFTREMGLDPCVSFPAGFELVETWWVVFLRHDLLIELAGVEFAVLGFAAVRAIGAAIGLTSRVSFLAATLYLLTPLFALQATSCLNDAPVAAMVLSVAALAASRAHLLLLAIPFALGVGLKGTFLYAAPCLALLYWYRREKEVLRPESLRWTVAPVAAAAVLGLFWYVRNSLWYGNPFHPVTPAGFDLGGVHVQAGPRPASLAANLSGLVSNLVYDHQVPYQSDSYRTAGWGVTAFAGGVVGLIRGLRQDRLLRALAAAFALALGAVLLMVSHDGWYPRFVLFFPALLCIGAARLAEESRPAALLILAGALLQFATTVLPSDLSPSKRSALVRQPWRERSVAPLFYCKDLPPGEPVAVYSTLRTITYKLYGPDFSRDVLYLRVRDADAMVAEMTRRNVRYVYIDVSSAHRKAQLETLIRASRLRRLNERLHVLE